MELAMDYLIPDNVYQVLKWLGLLFMPALAWLVSVVGPAWGYDVAPVVTTINAFGTFIGVIIGASQLHAGGE